MRFGNSVNREFPGGWWLGLLSVQFSSVAQSHPILCDPMDCSTPGFPVHHQLLELTQTHVHQVGDAIQPSHPLSSPSLPAFNLSQHQGLFKWISSSHQVAKVLEFQLYHQSFQRIFRTDFLRIDRLDLLAVQGTLKGLLQHHSSKASILWCSAFFRVQLSHPYMTTGKTIALTRWTFVGKVMSLLLNMLSRLVITFLPSSKRLLISWLQSPSAVILEPQKINLTVFTVSPSISHEVMGLDPKICHAESCSNNEFNSMQALVLGYSRPFGLWSLFSNLWMEYIDKGILDPRDDVQMTRQLWINYWFWECNNMLQDQVSCYGPVLSLFAY